MPAIVTNKFRIHNAKQFVEAFDEVSIPAWSYMAALMAAIIFISLAVLEITKNRLLFYISFAGTQFTKSDSRVITSRPCWKNTFVL